MERLRQLARNYADAADSYHKGKRLTAEDSMYFVAASLITSLSERVGELEREKQKLRGALKPLAAAYDIWVGHPDNMPLKISRIGPGDDADLTMANICEARALLSKQEEQKS